MIIQGLKLTLLGMIVVFSFLVLLLAVIHLCAKLFKPYTLKEASAITSRRPPTTGTPPFPEDNLRLAAIISAAICAHRKRTGRYKQP